MTTARIRGRAGPLLAVGLGLAACGGPQEEAVPVDAAPTEGVYGRAPRPSAGIPSVITLTPEDPVEITPAETPTIDQLGLQFSPTRLLAHPGEPVRFTNSESLAHNVQLQAVADGRMLLDADTPPGEVLTYTFEEEGGYDVTCGTHPGMRAFIYVTPAPYGAFADDDGSFHVVGVPPGAYTLRVWSADPEQRSERSIVVHAGAATEVDGPPLG